MRAGELSSPQAGAIAGYEGEEIDHEAYLFSQASVKCLCNGSADGMQSVQACRPHPNNNEPVFSSTLSSTHLFRWGEP